MATDIRWPENLRGILTEGKSRRQGAIFSMSDPKVAPPYKKIRSTDVPVFWDITLRFHSADAAAFRKWFENDISYGRRWFTMPVKTEFGLIDHDVVFMPDSLLVASREAEVFTYTATIMARKLIIPRKFTPDYFDCLLNVGMDSTSSQYNYGYYTKYGIGSVSDISTNLFAVDNGSLATLAGYLHRNSGAERGILFMILGNTGHTFEFLSDDPLTELTITVDGNVYPCGAYSDISSSGNYVWNSPGAADFQQLWLTDETVGQDIAVEMRFTHAD